MMQLIRTVEVERRGGAAVPVLAGQVLRVTMHAGKQVGDLTVVNLNDHQDGFSDKASTQLGGRSFRNIEALFSGPPHFNRLMTVADDPTGVHFVHGRCSTRMYELFDGTSDVRGCHENIVAAFATLGIDEKNVPFATFNAFMNVVVTPDGRYHFYPPVAETGAHVDFRAEMDVAVAISACPHTGEVNDGEPKPLLLEVFESSDKNGVGE